jgi:heat shock protein HslJ
MKKNALIIFAFLLMFALGGCHSSKSISGQTMNNKQMLYQYKWYLSELDGKPYTFVGKNNETSWLLFTEGSPSKVSGYTACNNLMGSVEVPDENSMKFLPLATTKMFCPGNEEASLLKALSSVTAYNIADTQLVLNNGNAVVAKFNGVSPGMERLSGTWELNYISGPKISFEGLYPDKKPTIIFNFSAKILMGNTSCNGFSSKYTINGNQIYFADALKTMMFCEGGGEDTFLSMLKKVNRYTVNGNMLTFMMDDIAVMRFAKQTEEIKNN